MLQNLIGEIKQNILPPPRLTVSQWADKYRVLSPEGSAEPGKWSCDRVPYQQGIMDACSEPGVHEVVLMSSAQVGKTEMSNCILGKFIHLDPCPILGVLPTLEMAEAHSKDRLAPMFRDTPILKKLVNGKSRDRNNTILHKNFPGGQLTLAGANSPASLASRPIRMVLLDEIDRYPPSAGGEGDPLLLARKRTTTFWNWLIFVISTPTIEGKSRIQSAYKQSDQRKFRVPCPHCGEKIELVWDNLKYPGKGTEKAQPKETFYECDRCGKPILESAKLEMLRQGEWVATATALNPHTVGFYINELYSPWRKWSDTALDYESARKDPQQLQVWWNTSLGLPWKLSEGEKLDWEELYRRSQGSDYQEGNVPDGVALLTAGVDVQADRLECSIWGWGKGEQAWLILHEQIFGDPLKDATWKQLEKMLRKSYKGLKVLAACIDSGFHTQEVYHQVKKRRSLHWYAIKGKSGEGKPLISRPSIQEINYQGRSLKQGIKLYSLGVDGAKEAIYARSRIEEPGPKYLNFPNDLDLEYFEGFCSEIQVKKHRSGQPYYVWEKLSGARNEPLDCVVYALAAAHLAGITRINWDKEQRQAVRVQESDKRNGREEKRVGGGNWVTDW